MTYGMHGHRRRLASERPNVRPVILYACGPGSKHTQTLLATRCEGLFSEVRAQRPPNHPRSARCHIAVDLCMQAHLEGPTTSFAV